MTISILVDADGDAVEASEKSALFVTLGFTDEDGNDVVPDSIKWTLVDLTGSVINTRAQVAVAVPAASVTIVLSGADLAIQTSEANSRNTVKRRLVVEAVYDSALGDNLPLNESCEFTIRNLKYIS